MSSTTKKHENFLSSHLCDKPVGCLPGVGPVAEQKLKAAGYNTGEQVLGKYLMLGKNSNQFKGWMENSVGASPRHSAACYSALSSWTDKYMK